MFKSENDLRDKQTQRWIMEGILPPRDEAVCLQQPLKGISSREKLN